MTNTKREEIEKRFDNKFGKKGLEGNSDSIGRAAGCDDCAISVEYREEMRMFFLSEIQTAIKEREDEIVDLLQHKKYPDTQDMAVIADIINLIQSKKV